MESKEKQLILSALSSILILAGYTGYVYSNYVSTNPTIVNETRFWGLSFLILIPVSIVAQILIHILFAIFLKVASNEEMETKLDERDKLIELRAIRTSHWVFIGGFLLAMASQAAGLPTWVMFCTLVLAGFLSSLVSDFMKIHYYRRGF